MKKYKEQIGMLLLVWTISSIFLMGCAAQAQIANDSKVKYQTLAILDDSSLPVFYEKLAQRLTFPLSWTSGNFKDFGNWKIKARAKVSEQLISNPPSVPFEPVVLNKLAKMHAI